MIDHDDCALDMQTGLNICGWPDTMPEAKPVLARGGTVFTTCPACDVAGESHMLEVRQVDRKFIVIAV